MRVALVTVGSTAATAAVIANAFYQKKQFYPSIVYLTKSNPSIAVLYAQVFVLVFLLGKAMRKIFFGQLRAAEIEHLIEKFWYVITETCLAFTVFRDDFSPRFVALFTFLLLMKAFHWLIEDRVDYMERSPIISALFHIRVCSLLAILGTLDSILINHAFRTTIASGASAQMVFGFEYAILLVMVVAIIMKYVLHTIDYMTEHPWENKNVYLLYAELITGFIKCCLYIAFVGVMVKIHTFPLFAIRPMYLTIRSFKKSLSDVILSRRAIAYMNTRFVDATEEELLQLDNTCIICREQMLVGKKLPCNHIFHAHCLRSWFQRQQSCPTCRMDVLSPRAQQQARAQQPPPAQQQPLHQPHAGPFMGMPPPPVSPFNLPSPNANQDVPLSQAPPGSSNIPGPSHFGFPGMAPPMGPFAAMGSSNPMFPMPPSFFGMPPPPPMMFTPPDLNLSALSLDELQGMEGQERENVEARLKLLRNVHLLLDTVIIQLNQYSQVITTLNAMPPSSVPSTVNLNQTSSANPSASTNAESTMTTNTAQSPVMATSVQSNEQATSSIGAEASTSNSETVENISTANNMDNNDTVGLTFNADSDNDLRRRRLAKFQSITKEKEKEKEEGEEEENKAE